MQWRQGHGNVGMWGEGTLGTWRCADAGMGECLDLQGCEDASTDPMVPSTEQTYLTQSLV